MFMPPNSTLIHYLLGCFLPISLRLLLSSFLIYFFIPLKPTFDRGLKVTPPKRRCWKVGQTFQSAFPGEALFNVLSPKSSTHTRKVLPRETHSERFVRPSNIFVWEHKSATFFARHNDHLLTTLKSASKMLYGRLSHFMRFRTTLPLFSIGRLFLSTFFMPHSTEAQKCDCFGSPRGLVVGMRRIRGDSISIETISILYING
jgi:hypothetical protein